MDQNTSTPVDYSQYSIDRLQKELSGVQAALEMLYTKNNSLEDLDLTEGGGSPEDQSEFHKLNQAQMTIVGEINKRHMLDEIR